MLALHPIYDFPSSFFPAREARKFPGRAIAALRNSVIPRKSFNSAVGNLRAEP